MKEQSIKNALLKEICPLLNIESPQIKPYDEIKVDDNELDFSKKGMAYEPVKDIIYIKKESLTFLNRNIFNGVRHKNLSYISDFACCLRLKWQYQYDYKQIISGVWETKQELMEELEYDGKAFGWAFTLAFIDLPNQEKNKIVNSIIDEDSPYYEQFWYYYKKLEEIYRFEEE